MGTLNQLYLFCFGCFLVFGCVNNSTEPKDESNSNEIEVTEEQEMLEAASLMDDTDNESETNAQNWQITDYVEHLHGEKVAESHSDLAPEDGVNWFYQTLDIKGGYANITGAVEGWKEYVIWRMKGESDLVGELSVGCGPACSYDFQFFKGKGKNIETIETSEIIPVDELMEYANALKPKALEKYPVDYEEDMQLIYVFPQKGTDMQVDLVFGADEMRIKLAMLEWNKEKFSVISHQSTVEIITG